MNLTTANTNRFAKEGSAGFLIKIMFRKNYNWQGEVHWLDTDQKRRFRSSLELLMLLQEAMEETGAPPAEYSFRTWKHEEAENPAAEEIVRPTL